MKLSQSQLEVLSLGPSFGVPPHHVDKEVILGEFGIFYSQLEHHMPNNPAEKTHELQA